MADLNLPPTMLCDDLRADLVPEQSYGSNARHYNVTRMGELVGQLSCRTPDLPHPSPGWWVWVDEEHRLLSDPETQAVRYFPNPQDAFQALSQHLKDWLAGVLNPNA